MDNTDLKMESHMRALECVMRVIRLPLVVIFAIVACESIMDITTGWKHALLFPITLAFVFATEILEILLILRASRERR